MLAYITAFCALEVCDLLFLWSLALGAQDSISSCGLMCVSSLGSLPDGGVVAHPRHRCISLGASRLARGAEECTRCQHLIWLSGSIFEPIGETV